MVIVLLFSVGELSGRIPICAICYAITVTHNSYSVVSEQLNVFCLIIILNEFAIVKWLAEKYLTFLLLLY